MLCKQQLAASSIDAPSAPSESAESRAIASSMENVLAQNAAPSAKFSFEVQKATEGLVSYRSIADPDLSDDESRSLCHWHTADTPPNTAKQLNVQSFGDKKSTPAFHAKKKLCTPQRSLAAAVSTETKVAIDEDCADWGAAEGNVHPEKDIENSSPQNRRFAPAGSDFVWNIRHFSTLAATGAALRSTSKTAVLIRRPSPTGRSVEMRIFDDFQALLDTLHTTRVPYLAAAAAATGKTRISNTHNEEAGMTAAGSNRRTSHADWTSAFGLRRNSKPHAAVLEAAAVISVSKSASLQAKRHVLLPARRMSANGANLSRSCGSCGAVKTPYWRDGWGHAVVLCNACGLRYHKFKKHCFSCKYIPRKEEQLSLRCSQCNESW